MTDDPAGWLRQYGGEFNLMPWQFGVLRRMYAGREPFKLTLPDPVPHDLAEVWNNANAVVARTCQRCGKTFGPYQLAVHPDDQQAFARLADREGYEVIVDPYVPKGKAIRMDPVALDFLGCPSA